LKVKISYTVELDDVPNQVCKLLSDHDLNLLTKQFNELNEIISSNNINNALFNIDLFRRKLAGLDQTLDDAQSILDGYMRARYSNSNEAE
jgi:hypothetical protein